MCIFEALFKYNTKYLVFDLKGKVRRQMLEQLNSFASETWTSGQDRNASNFFFLEGDSRW